VFLQINNAFGAGKLCLSWNYGNIHLGGWRASLCGRRWSRSESSSVVDRISTKNICCVSLSHSMVLTFSLSRLTLEI
jgi:hypothetical protein